jgi:hypothetical protein
MKSRYLLSAVLAVGVILFGGISSQAAAPVTSCDTTAAPNFGCSGDAVCNAIQKTATDTWSAWDSEAFRSKRATQDYCALQEKLGNAKTKYSQKKNADAAQKLCDYNSQVNTLGVQGKLDLYWAGVLSADATSAVQLLGFSGCP